MAVRLQGKTVAAAKPYKLRQMRAKDFDNSKFNDLAILSAPRWRYASPRMVLRESRKRCVISYNVLFSVKYSSML